MGPGSDGGGRNLMAEAVKMGEMISVGDMLTTWGTDQQKLVTHKMYFVVNNDLGMGKGKLCAQVGHAVAEWTRRLEKQPTDEYNHWKKHLEPKIVLKSTEENMRQLLAKYPQSTVAIIDAGRTQVAPNSFTVLAFAPTNAPPPELQSLKLL